MSYQVLARKYRPRSFDTLVGQEHVVRALTHALDSKRLHHAYLFTGTRGVGKTTLSRILAKAFNCRGTDGNGDITSQPCGVCDACTAIDAGRFVDYIELDAASNRGVDEMAQLLEQAVYAPSNARFKVYMIDEVHMLTNHAFNAMLKTLEEPPEHVKFILATTDPQKIPVTVLSRCLQFNLKQMPPGHIVGHLDNILGQEGIAFETSALRLLAQGAHGSMRDALSLTDQAIAYAAGEVTLDAVQGMLGALDQTYLLRLLDALAVRDGAALLAIADEMAARSLSYGGALRDLGTLLHQIALAQTVPTALAEDLPERAAIVQLAAKFAADEVQLFYQIVVHGRNELGLAPDEYAGFSMTLLRMLAFRPQFAGDVVLKSVPKASGEVTAATSASATSTKSTLSASSVPAPSAPPASPARLHVTPTVATQSVVVPRPLSPGRAALDAARGIVRPSVGVGGGGVNDGASVQIAPIVRSSSRAAVVGDSVPTAAKAEEVAKVLQGVGALNTVPHFSDNQMPPLGEFHDDLQPAAVPTPQRKSTIVTPAIVESHSIPSPVAIPELNWDGDWPALAIYLPLRGVTQQLALQAELVECKFGGGDLAERESSNGVDLRLRVPLETLATPANIDKLASTLSAHFSQSVRLTIDIGNVRHTANTKAESERAQRQRDAELQIQSDPFVLSMMREFGATIVPGSIKPI